MKVKLIKSICDIHRQYHDYDYIDVCKYLSDAFSDWEEISDKDYTSLEEFVIRHNSQSTHSKFFLITENSQLAAKIAIAEQIQFEKDKEELRQKELEKRKIEDQKYLEAKAAKKKARLEKQLEKLKEQLNEN